MIWTDADVARAMDLYARGLTWPQIAQELQCTVPSVRSACSRKRGKRTATGAGRHKPPLSLPEVRPKVTIQEVLDYANAHGRLHYGDAVNRMESNRNEKP